MIIEYFRIAFRNLRKRPLRSWLTIFGVVIGVFMVASLLSLSEGIKESILRELRIMGGDLIMVFPGELSEIITTFIGGLELEDSDLTAILRSRGVQQVIPWRQKAELVRWQEESGKTVIVAGIPLSEAATVLQEDMGMNTIEGRWIQRNRREVLVGNLVPQDIFHGLKSGDRLSIKGTTFEVAGVLRSLGNRQDDSMLVMDMEMFGNVTGIKDGAQAAVVKIAPGVEANVVAENIRQELEKSRKRRAGTETPSFSVLTGEAATETIGNVMAIVQFVIMAFASIAILVGAIGIMNTMYTSVFERTKEIGILKAVGAKRKDIIAIFLIESGVIGFVGGLGGVALGFAAAKTVELYGQFHPVLYIKASTSLWLALSALAATFLIGAASGYLPARKAASLNPVDALRYE